MLDMEFSHYSASGNCTHANTVDTCMRLSMRKAAQDSTSKGRRRFVKTDSG